MSSKFLSKIISEKRYEISRMNTEANRRIAENSPAEHGLLNALRREGMDGVRVIAEFKRAKPAIEDGKVQIKDIRPDADPREISLAYRRAGAAAISVVNDVPNFRTSTRDMRTISETAGLPVLAKDFVIDEAQIYQSRIYGAQAVLLITTMLDNKALPRLVKVTHSLGMDAVVECHNELGLRRAVDSGTRIIGINNRDIETLEMNEYNVHHLAELVPPLWKIIAESGITKADQILSLPRNVDGVLIGTSLMDGTRNHTIRDVELTLSEFVEAANATLRSDAE